MGGGTRLRLSALVVGIGAAGAVSQAQHPVLDGVDLYPYGSTISQNLVVWQNTVYATSAQAWSGSASLFAVDATDPVNLTYLSGVDSGAKTYGIDARDDILYVAAWGSGLRVYDISQPSVFQPRWSFYDCSAYWNVIASGQRAYVTAGDADHPECIGVRILNASTSPSGSRLISLLPGSHPNIRGMAVRGSYLYFTDYQHFKVANISNEQAPQVIRSFHHPRSYNLNGVRLRGDYAYLYGQLKSPQQAGDPGLVIYDITDRANPVEVGRYDQAGAHDMYLLGDYALLATSGAGVRTVNIANPASPTPVTGTDVDSCTDALVAYEVSVTGNGIYGYTGTLEMYIHPPGHPDVGNNYWKGKLYSMRVLSEEPDNVGPERWSGCSTGEASWDTQYEGDTLPTGATPAWSAVSGSESWATVTEGTLRVNDTGTGTDSQIRWRRNWDATYSRGTTVLVRARCPSYDPAGGSAVSLVNLIVEDGKRIEEFTILSDRFRANKANIECPLDGTAWHTYRITTGGGQFKVYVDELSLPVLTGPMTSPTGQARISFGGGSDACRQDISFDFVHCFSDGVVAPPAQLSTETPTLSVHVADSEGKGSLSGINPTSAAVYWSTDGGTTWSQSGGMLWDGQYEADVLPSAALPPWSVTEGNESLGSVSAGILHVSDTSTASGSKVKWARSWNASASTGTTVLARARCTAVGGDTTLLGNLFVEDGAHREQFKIMPDRLVAMELGVTHLLDGTQWHLYRVTTKGNQFKVYVDEDPTPVLTGALATASTQNRVLFGSGASAGTQEIDFDYVRYTAVGDLPPGQGDGGGPVQVVCSGAFGDDRGVIAAYSIPLSRGSGTVNRVRFGLRDTAGNMGLSPIYGIPIKVTVPPDFDEDNDVDQEDFGHLQACFSGADVRAPGCEDADLSLDLVVDIDDLRLFQSCMAGPDQAPSCSW